MRLTIRRRLIANIDHGWSVLCVYVAQLTQRLSPDSVHFNFAKHVRFRYLGPA